MGPANDLEGYYYKDLPQRALDSKGNTRKNDYTKEWAIAAINAAYSQTTGRVFLVDNSGKILMKYTIETPEIWPHDPPANGWQVITDIEQIRHQR